MRILYCIPNMAGGGAERQLVYIARELVRRGWDVHVALLKEGPNYDALVTTGAIIHKIPAWGNYDLSILLRLVKLIRVIKPDIIQTWITQMDVFGGIVAKFTGNTFILSERSSASAYPSTWKRWLRNRVAAGADAIVSNSVGGDSYWESNLSHVPRYVVANGVPITEIDRAEPGFPAALLDPGVPLVLYVGRLPGRGVATKNLPLFLEALALVKEKHKIAGVFCGEGPRVNELQDLAHKLGLDADIYFTGHLAPFPVWALMKKASVFVSISAYEGLPNAVLEAMACGCPLVLSDIPAHRAILDDDQAVFVDPLKTADVANAILTCIQNPERAKQMAQNAKAGLAKYSISAVTAQYEEMYRQVLANS